MLYFSKSLAEKKSGWDNALNRSSTILQMLSTILQMGAIIIGGAWAYHHFGLFESPELEHRLRISGDLHWQDFESSSHCVGWYKIKVENIGKRTVELKELVLQAWYLDPLDPLNPRRLEDPITYIDAVNEVVVTTHLTEAYVLEPEPNVTKTLDVFQRKYPPSVSEEAAFMMLTKKAPTRWIVLKATGKSQIANYQHTWIDEIVKFVGVSTTTETKEENWHDHRTERVCESPQEANSSVPKTR